MLFKPQLVVVLISAAFAVDIDPVKMENAKSICLAGSGVSSVEFQAAMDVLDPDAVSHDIKCVTKCSMERLGIMSKSGMFERNVYTEPYPDCFNREEPDLCDRAWAYHICVVKTKKGIARK